MLLTFKLREISYRSSDRALALEVSRHPALPCDDITFAVDCNNSLQCRRGNMLKVPSPKPPHGSGSLDQWKQAGSHLPRQFPGCVCLEEAGNTALTIPGPDAYYTQHAVYTRMLSLSCSPRKVRRGVPPFLPTLSSTSGSTLLGPT